jgi:L-asparaginase/Glu-tRNA(Gln) amidotransferase subunit D
MAYSEKQSEFLQMAERRGVEARHFGEHVPEIRFREEKPDTSKPTIAYLHTGGTLMMVPSPVKDGVLSFEGATDITAAINVCDAVARVRNRYNLIGVYLASLDSIEVGPEHWSAMAAAIKAIYDQVEGVVIGHGTHTAEYSAAALAFALRNPSKPIVVTASQIPLVGFPGSDAMANLTGAMELAANGDLAEVVGYAAGTIHRGTRMRKVEDSRLAVFDSPITGPLGYFGAGGIELVPGARRRKGKRDFDLKYLPDFATTVSTIKYTPGMNQRIIGENISEAGDVGIIFETPGSGAIPARFVPTLSAHAQRGFPVFLTSSATQSGISTGMTLHDEAAVANYKAGIKTAGDMTTGAATVKLMAILGSSPGLGLEEINEEMIGKSYAGEISVQKGREDY